MIYKTVIQATQNTVYSRKGTVIFHSILLFLSCTFILSITTTGRKKQQKNRKYVGMYLIHFFL